MMWGRIKANDLGQPVGIFLSAHARRVLGSKPYVLEVAPDSKALILRDDPAGFPIPKTGYIGAKAELARLNQLARLSDEPFPIRRSGGEFVLEIYNTNPHLSSSRVTAPIAPMRVTRSQPRYRLKNVELVQLFALWSLRQGRLVEEADFATDALEGYPSREECQARFGTFAAFREFVGFQVGRLENLSESRRAEMEAGLLLKLQEGVAGG